MDIQRFQYGTASGQLMWNITALLSSIGANEHVACCRVDSLPKIRETQVDVKHAQVVNLSSPLIIAELAPAKELVIDGNHRIYKARLQKRGVLPAIRLDKNRYASFIEDFDEDVFAVVTKESSFQKFVYVDPVACEDGQLIND